MNINKVWLKDENDNLLAPKTLTSCIQDENGNSFQEYADKMIIMDEEETTEVPEGLTSCISNQDIYNIVTDAYDSTKTYAVGDYCIYNNILYKCTTAIETAEEFDSSKWDATSVDSEIGELNNKLTILSDNNILEQGLVLGVGYYRKYTDGTLELWSRMEKNLTFPNALVTGSLYYSEQITMPLAIQPISTKYIGVTAWNSGMAWAIRPQVIDKTVAFYVIQGGANERATELEYHIIGTWK